jgi:hypothetical protein
MNRRHIIMLTCIVAAAVALIIFKVSFYKKHGGVYIGTYPTLSPKAADDMAELGVELSAAEKAIEGDMSTNANLKTDYLDPLEKIAGDPDAPPNFRLLTEGLQLENKLVAVEAESNSRGLQILVAVDEGILNRKRYDSLDSGLVALEDSFQKRDSAMSALSDQQKTINSILELIHQNDSNSPEMPHLKELTMICTVQGLQADKVIEHYTNELKVGTSTLRSVVDDMATGSSKN